MSQLQIPSARSSSLALPDRSDERGVRSTSVTVLAVVAALSLLVAVPGAHPASALENVFVIEGGYVSGMELEGGVTAFLGIPYAAPPVGELRFRPPAPVVPWPALYEAIVAGPACMQAPYPEDSFYSSPTEEQSEDCLYLNVWTAAESPDERRPVMVWIHGGALTRGSGANPVYDGAALARKGAVVVTINYRLNVFGYFAHPALSVEGEHGSSGNYGVLDQIAALEWVRDNVELFGGDPERVTIFGESAGSWSVNALQASPLARGLFHRVIGQSGGAFGTMPRLDRDLPDLPSAESVGVELVSSLGVGAGDDAAEQLRALDAAELLAAASRSGAFRTRPNVDGWAFPQPIHAIFEQGEQADVPVLLGSNADEATSLFGRFAPQDLEALRSRAEREFGDRADELLEIYGAVDDASARAAGLDWLTDRSFTCQMRTWARLMETVESPAFLYFFTRVPPHPERETYGAYHAAEIAYAFDNLDAVPYEWESTDHELADAISDIWFSFAEDGDPSIARGEFPAYDEQGTYLELGDRVAASSGLAGPACDFFDAVQARQRAAVAAALGASGGP